jgi:hypothetical protein
VECKVADWIELNVNSAIVRRLTTVLLCILSHSLFYDCVGI